MSALIVNVVFCILIVTTGWYVTHGAIMIQRTQKQELLDSRNRVAKSIIHLALRDYSCIKNIDIKNYKLTSNGPYYADVDIYVSDDIYVADVLTYGPISIEKILDSRIISVVLDKYKLNNVNIVFENKGEEL